MEPEGGKSPGSSFSRSCGRSRKGCWGPSILGTAVAEAERQQDAGDFSRSAMQAPSAGSAGAQPNNAVQMLDAIRVERRAWGSSEWTSAGHRGKPTSRHKCLCVPGLPASSDGWEECSRMNLIPNVKLTQDGTSLVTPKLKY